MLGWEFPPHISGGLGTACYGLSQGLAQNGVEVTFVVPRLTGDESARGVELVGAADVAVPTAEALHERERRRAERRAQGERAEHADVPVRLRHAFTGRRDARRVDVAAGGERLPRSQASGDGERGFARAVRLLSIDSPLRPYMTEADYRRELEELARLGHEAARTRSVSSASPRSQAELQRTAAAQRARTESGAAAAFHPGEARILRAQGEPRLAPPERAADSAQSATDSVGDCTEPREHLAFQGGYGPDLAAEVLRYARVVREVATRQDFDVVHAHDWMTYPAGIAAAQAAGKPLVVHVHACEYDRSGSNANPRIRAIEQEGLAHADRVVCVSEYTAGVLRRHYGADPAKLRVVHNAVTRREQRAHLHVEKAIDDPVVLFLGRITYQKGPDYFLEAAARVLRVLPDARFVLSGTGDMWPRMVERAAQLGIGANTHFTGFLQGAEVERMFALADIYVMPSVSEPFGISPLEAMALDVPVIVSRQSGVAEVLTNALKVDFWDVEDLANKIIALLSYPALREELLAEGRQEVLRMSWEERGRSLVGVYREVLA